MTMTAQAKLSAARKITQNLLLAISAAKHNYVMDMTVNLGCSLDDFDFKAFDDHLSDAISDFDHAAMDKIRDEARDEESDQAFAEEQADRRDYHSRVA